MPVAPYTVVNWLAGAVGVGFRPFMAGTTLGLIPGVVALSVLGDRVRAFAENPGWGSALTLGAVGLAAFGGLWFVRRRLESRVRAASS